MASIVGSARFKILPVPTRCSIREFTVSEGFEFRPGRGFYQLTKPETIQTYKEIVAVSIADGTKVTGSRVREILKIPAESAKFKLSQEILNDFKIFVQSTSYNRVLLPGTEFLYEADPDAAATEAVMEDRPPPPPAGAGMPIEIAFSFDTTGSMSSCITMVRDKLQDIIKRLQEDIPNIKIAVFAHGDYCDARNNYVTKFIDFSTDVTALCDFVRNVESTGGGDWEECYELVLKEAREKLSWTPGTQRALVMIGDAIPHPKSHYTGYIKKPFIDWKVETDRIVRDLGCRIYSVQCHGASSTATYFWKHMATYTHGHHLLLNNFSSVVDFIMAICYREQGPEQLEAYRQEVTRRVTASGGGGMTQELRSLFDSLKGGHGIPATSPSAAAFSSSAAAPSTGRAAVPSTGRAAAGTKRKATSSPAARPAKVAKKPPAKKAPVKKAPAKKAPVKKAPVKKAPVKKARAKKPPAKKAPAAKTKAAAKGKAAAKKSPAKGAAAKKAPAKKPAPKKPAAKKPKPAPKKKAPVKKSPAAKSKKPSRKR